MNDAMNAPKKRSKKWWIIGGSVFGFLVIMWAVGIQVPDEPATEAASVEEVKPPVPEPKKDKKTEPAPPEEKAEPKPAAKPKPEPKPEPEKVESKKPEAKKESLAVLVEQKIEENFPGGMGTGTPLYAVTEYEDVSKGTVRVYVQESLTKDGRGTIARHVFNLGGYNNDDLKTVVVRDTSGVDSNHYR